jgi:Ni/Co efflux regulator RcnB
MKRTMLAAVVGGFMALTASAFTAQAAPLTAVKAGQAAQSGETLVQKTGWRHHHRHYRHRHYRPYYSYPYRRYYRPHYVYRSYDWRPRHYYYGRHTHRHHRRHYY